MGLKQNALLPLGYGKDTIMPLNEEGFITRVSLRHSVSPDAVRTILRALRSGGGTMAQFSHSDFGGMSQWSPAVPEVSVTPLPVKAKRKIAKRAPPSRWTAYRPAARAEALPLGGSSSWGSANCA